MAIGWFLVPYKIKHTGFRMRYPAIDDYTNKIIYEEGGVWSEFETLGNHCVVKVRAASETLQMLSGVEGFIKFPKTILTESLSELTNNQKKALRDKLIDLGFTPAEILNDLGTDMGSKTFRELLLLLNKRRKTARFNIATGTYICDGPELPTVPLAVIDNMVA